MTEQEVKFWTVALRREKHQILMMADEINDAKKALILIKTMPGVFSLLVRSVPFKVDQEPLFENNILLDTPETWWSDAKLDSVKARIECAKQYLLSLIDLHTTEEWNEAHTESVI